MVSSPFILRQLSLPQRVRSKVLLNTGYPALAALRQVQSGVHIKFYNALYSTQAAIPDLTDKPYYITTPIFYVNAVPHIGHLHSAVLADTFKRFHVMKGRKALLSTGTDEHGLKIQQAAMLAGVKEIDLCDQVSQRFKDLFDAANISYTTYIRTTEPRHTITVKELWQKLWDNGYIYKGQHEGWYSISDEAFYASTQVEERIDEKTGSKYHIAIETGKLVEWTTEENYKFKLSAFTDRLLEWLDQNPDAIVPKSRHQEVQSWIRNGLSDLSVSRSRSRLTWGIPIPGDDSHVMYVWMDALTNYLTVAGYPWKDSDMEKNQAYGWPADAQVVGKDILRFHAVYWPAFLMAAKLDLPKRIVAHAHWTQRKMKMSKSIGNVVDPFTAMEEFGTDTIRFYLMNDGGLVDDTDYSSSLVMERYRKLLAGQLGNLLNRSISLALNPSSKIPAAPSMENVHPEDKHLHLRLQVVSNAYNDAMSNYRTTQATQAIFEMLAEANVHISQCKPWDLIKDPSKKDRLDTVLWYSMESVRLAALLLQPIIPTKASEILDQLAITKEERSWDFAYLGRGWMKDLEARRVRPSGPVFPPLKPTKNKQL
ncbi:tRNA synthetases class I (M)-domain-containing protein [Lobosporangium transversale]|uniref:Probable methionine--tRNA ligase, mitochondrial n=1 Tax=Lobosporangium transversale TaxID=64571 RepID=A0A1Y2GXT8_9FUNG|nr:tRNA synthetases class I (M)-domain-containing protein [Lobosporangium transversale]ORZ27075.1 tRNA synthetases class I (M)-domain-containing protein [Lobosporangium transversale]|eukprot:XP_021884822.1 tRNA synthetases class I (M)-domain-containing protein [Lobosporangium transversale]